MKKFYEMTNIWSITSAFCVVSVLGGCASNNLAPVQDRSASAQRLNVSGGDTYVVKKGDTLYSIAREHGMDFRELVALNRIENPNVISEGLVLRVKGRSGNPNAVTAAGVSTAPVTSEQVVVRPIGQGGSSPIIGDGKSKTDPKAGKVPYSDQALADAQNASGARNEVATAGSNAKEQSASVTNDKSTSSDNKVVATSWVWPAQGSVVASFSDSGNKGVDIGGKAGDPVLAVDDGKVVYSGSSLRAYGNLVIIKHDAVLLTAYANNKSLLVKEGQVVKKGQKIAEMGNSGTDKVKLHFEVRRQGKPVDPLKYLPQK